MTTKTTMKTNRLWLLLLLPLFALCLGACSASPRPTTAEERAQANQTLTLIEAAVTAAAVAGKVTPAQLEKAQQTIAVLRTTVAQSETEPMGIADLTLRIANLAATWVPAQPPK